MASNRKNNILIINLVQVSQHQADTRYGASRAMQYSWMSLMTISWTLFMLPSFWDLLDLDTILQKGNELFKSLHKFRCLGVDDLLHGFVIKTCFITADFLENRTGEITGVIYFVSITEIISSCHKLRKEALLNSNN